jgi:hypothetical protein
VTTEQQITLLDEMYWCLDKSLKALGPLFPHTLGVLTEAEYMLRDAQDVIELLESLIEPDDETLDLGESEEWNPYVDGPNDDAAYPKGGDPCPDDVELEPRPTCF